MDNNYFCEWTITWVGRAHGRVGPWVATFAAHWTHLAPEDLHFRAPMPHHCPAVFLFRPPAELGRSQQFAARSRWPGLAPPGWFRRHFSWILDRPKWQQGSRPDPARLASAR